MLLKQCAMGKRSSGTFRFSTFWKCRRYLEISWNELEIHAWKGSVGLSLPCDAYANIPTIWSLFITFKTLPPGSSRQRTKDSQSVSCPGTDFSWMWLAQQDCFIMPSTQVQCKQGFYSHVLAECKQRSLKSGAALNFGGEERTFQIH